MCGIVGYYGPKNPKDVILAGLKSMEYRGYDSAGVAIFDGKSIKRIRAEGKLGALEEKLKTESFDGHMGIGHTRWATHGPPVERNAHPHTVRGVSIVHNGIIENYMELREELGPGTKFESDTDSELVAHVLARAIDSGKNLLDAVLSVLPILRGAFSIVTVSEKYPNQMVAFKNGPPLLVGQENGAVIIASDAQAILQHTNKVVHLEDNEIVCVNGERVSFFSRDGKAIQKSVQVIDWTSERAQKEGYPHFMLKEIFEQPRAIAQAMRPHIDVATHSEKMQIVGSENFDWAATEKIVIVACGTSYYAAMVGKYLIESLAKISVELDIASEYRYRSPVISKNTVGMVISQSGETADTLAVLRQMKDLGIKTLSLCNVKNSSIDREADGHLYMGSGVEVGVASTKAFTCTLAMMNLFALKLAKAKKHLNGTQENTFIKALLAVPAQMENVLACDKFFAAAANSLKSYKGFLYLGRGVSYPLALEGALKLKELAYMHAEGYAAGEMKHGPLALIDDRMAVVVLAPTDGVYEKTLSNLEEAKARGGHIISIGNYGNEQLKKLSLHNLTLPKTEWTTTPILEAVPVQLMAYHVATAMGHDVDQPRNLAKSVTVE
jgi:glucosamine--fructose-6-phosphate aminotransferase (isomerizing)